jgi:hypothetical protein
LQRLALDRVEDAQVLLAAGRWSSAYYLLGYAVELGLKSCILRHIQETGVLFQKESYRDELRKCWTHKFATLVQIAELEETPDKLIPPNTVLAAKWAVVNKWSEADRYSDKTEANAREMFEAVTHDPDGVLKWIQQYW